MEWGPRIGTDVGCWYSEDNERLDDAVPRRTVLAEQRIELTAEQVKFLEKLDPWFKERHIQKAAGQRN